MATDRDEGPVYYREIQKNSYLKRIPNEPSISKLIPLGSKKPPLKPMWTQLCIHNGRTPYLEQYPDSVHPSSLAHRPVWRACLSAARHVTGSVRPRQGQEYDFLVDTDHGPVRMLAPDWETMQDWVKTLRSKLAELKIVSKGENVYCAPPAPPVPRAAARDPTSPLPPTPAVPPDRVPGIEITPNIRPSVETSTPVEQTSNESPTSETDPVDISNWEPSSSLPGTSQGRDRKNVAKICGQNICLDDSVLNRDSTESDEEFFAEIDRAAESVAEIASIDGEEFRQTVVVGNDGASSDTEHDTSERPSNITVIKVSNKDAPHTAIPVLGSENGVFDFDFVKSETDPNFVNIVNTEVNVQNSNDYGTVFSDNNDYGHLSMTTTVNVTAVNPASVSSAAVNVIAENATAVDVKEQDGLYERLCMASTSTEPMPSPLPRRLKLFEKTRKSSLPNLETSDSTYEYLFLSQNTNGSSVVLNNSVRTNEGVINTVNNTNSVSIAQTDNINTVSTVQTNNTNFVSTVQQNNTNSVSTAQVNNNSVSIAQISNTNPVSTVQSNTINTGSTVQMNNTNNVTMVSRFEVNENHAIENVDYRDLRSNVERSLSHNSYDTSPRRRIDRRLRNSSPKRDGKTDKTEPGPNKPIWKRGLTELSLLTRLRSLGNMRRESPTRPENESGDRSAAGKVIHRSRTDSRVDPNRRRSNSLSNESPPAESSRYSRQSGASGGGGLRLQTLRVRQACWLMNEQRQGAAHVATVMQSQPPLFVDWNKQVWVARWGVGCGRWRGRCGDRVAGVVGVAPRDSAHALALLQRARPHTLARTVDILFHRVPMGQIYVINKRDKEAIGIKLDGECNVVTVEPNSPAARAGLPPPGKWALTEVNNRTINLVKGGEEEMNLISLHGTEVSVIIQPSMFVKKLRTALKGSKSILGLR